MSELPHHEQPEYRHNQVVKLEAPEDRDARIDMLHDDDATIMKLFLSQQTHVGFITKPHEAYAKSLLKKLSPPDEADFETEERDAQYRARLTEMVDRVDLRDIDDAQYEQLLEDPVFNRIMSWLMATRQSRGLTLEREVAEKLARLRAGQPMRLQQRPDEQADTSWNIICDHVLATH